MVARSHQDLVVHQKGYALAMDLFELSKGFPKEEKYSLTDQVRRSSRSVTVNIAEAWARRRYEASFVARLTDSMAEAAETLDWISYARDCQYLAETDYDRLTAAYGEVTRTLNAMVLHSKDWCKAERAFKPIQRHDN